jgi:D-alanyl-D-alanine dipeptidase
MKTPLKFVPLLFRLGAPVLLFASAVAGQDRPVIFRITPVRPVEELRKEALAAQPPEEHGLFRNRIWWN